MEIRFAVIPLMAIISKQIFAHATTAQLSCHVQNFVSITVLESRWNDISIKFELRWKTVSEMGPSSSCGYVYCCRIL